MSLSLACRVWVVLAVPEKAGIEKGAGEIEAGLVRKGGAAKIGAGAEAATVAGGIGAGPGIGVEGTRAGLATAKETKRAEARAAVVE